MSARTAVLGLPVLLALAVPATAQVGGQDPDARPAVLRSPVRAAVDPTGDVWVTDDASRRVCLLSPDTLEVRRSFAIRGRPSAIGCFAGRLYVGNETLARVEIYTPHGALLGVLGGPAHRVEDPRDLAVDEAQGRLFLVAGRAAEVRVYDLSTPAAPPVQVIGSPGSVADELQNPTGIALDVAAQEVFVSDFGALGSGADPRILIFGFDGSFHGWIWGYSFPEGQRFARPQGLWVGPTGLVFVVDSWRGEVVAIDRVSGARVKTLGEYGRRPGQLLLPLDVVATGPNDDLIVTSARSGRVVRFAKGGRP